MPEDGLRYGRDARLEAKTNPTSAGAEAELAEADLAPVRQRARRQVEDDGASLRQVWAEFLEEERLAPFPRERDLRRGVRRVFLPTGDQGGLIARKGHRLVL